MSVVSIGVDVGGTKTAAALVTRDGQVLHERITRSTAEGVEAAVSLAEALAADAISKGFELAGLGAGFPEHVDARGRLTSREVLAWRVQPADAFAAVVPGGCCVIDSGVRCGALAEKQLGAGRGLDRFLDVSLGTGLSSALVVGGSPLHGHRGEAIALGEMDAGTRRLASTSNCSALDAASAPDTSSAQVKAALGSRAAQVGAGLSTHGR